MGRKRAGALPQLVHTYRGVTLDPFQQEAIVRLQQDTSTLVCAPTGTGKTLIAEWLVDQCLQQGQRVIYTAPIKALANQKYRDFAQRFGASHAGIVTGDVAHQPQAGVVVMTTEILRNTLLRGEGLHPDVTWIVFDEIHFLNHPERGTVWEEALLLLDGRRQILGLSATVANPEEIGQWMASVLGEPVAVIRHDERAVPLVHRFFNRACQAVTRDKLLEVYLQKLLPHRDDLDLKGGTVRFEDVWDREAIPSYRDETDHLDVVFHAARNGLFPLLYFVFSRRGCEEKARQLARRRDYLQAREKDAVRVTIKQMLQDLQARPEELPGFSDHQALWFRGIGVHHAGLLPAVKSIVEALLERRLLRVVYATETFAVGVNMPVRTVAFDSLEKPSDEAGGRVRPLDAQEYFQMAGRAGRRGWDRQGVALTKVDFSRLHLQPPPDWSQTPLAPIESRLRLTYHTVANLIMGFSDQQVLELFRKSLAQFQFQRRGDGLLRGDGRVSESAGEPAASHEGISAAALGPGGSDLDPGLDPAGRLFAEYRQRRDVLHRLGYALPPEETDADGGSADDRYADGGRTDDGWRLTERGLALRHCAVKELLMCELLFDDTLAQLSPPELAGLASALVAPALPASVPAPPSASGPGAAGSGRRQRNRPPRPMASPPAWLATITLLQQRLLGRVGQAAGDLRVEPAFAPAVTAWARGSSLEAVLEEFPLEAGDFVALTRQTLDVLRQWKAAAGPRHAAWRNLREAAAALDRGVVRVQL